ncbi:hypothetical protein ACFWXK_10165 [Streptomyces sp. NPDC059070]|uniref:hypothetical protein n=1 Tax=Streptomyces sp. NPDC059070 TaxID=3346713 RepID=UPI0036736AA8
MDPIPVEALCASVADRFGVGPAAVEGALLFALEYVLAEAWNPAVAELGLTPAEYLRRAVETPYFEATLSTSALIADGREAEARQNWESYRQREQEAVKRAHQAVPPTAPLGDPEAIYRTGRQLGLSVEQTDEAASHVVRSVATGYPYRPADQWHLSLTDVLAQVTTEDLTLLLQLSARPGSEPTQDPDPLS